jgi:hypothetical protein
LIDKGIEAYKSAAEKADESDGGRLRVRSETTMEQNSRPSISEEVPLP